tara:strand:+ start:38 stop:256 length:219 start_codon:yes stop_codon:yes gene_type:complete
MTTKIIDVKTKSNQEPMSLDSFINHFQSLCNKYFIFPDIALENESILDIFENDQLSKHEKLKLVDQVLLNEF